MTNKQALLIKPIAKHHGNFLLLLGTSLLIIIFFLALNFWFQAKLIIIFLVMVSIFLILLGVLKIAEPQQSFILSPSTLTYAHRYGQWSLSWQHIRYMSQLTVEQSFHYQPLPFIGIKLLSLESIIDHISPRLASRLIHEQKPLLIVAINARLAKAEQVVINFSPYKTSNGTIITGPIAGFLHQCDALHQALGYHLYIPRSAIDRDIEDFVKLLNQCKKSALDHETG